MRAIVPRAAVVLSLLTTACGSSEGPPQTVRSGATRSGYEVEVTGPKSVPAKAYFKLTARVKGPPNTELHIAQMGVFMSTHGCEITQIGATGPWRGSDLREDFKNLRGSPADTYHPAVEVISLRPQGSVELPISARALAGSDLAIVDAGVRGCRIKVSVGVLASAELKTAVK